MASTTQPRIELVYFDAGGGHRTAKNALSAALARSHPHWDVVPVNLQQLLLPVDPVFRATRIRSENVYNTAVQRGWTRRSRPFLRALQKGIRLNAPLIERELLRHWRSARPDMVVSLIPNFNAMMFRALSAVDPSIPYVTIMTDIADTPPNFWQEPQDQFLICGSDKAYLQARLAGWYRSERLFKTSGMIVSPSFYDEPQEPLLSRASLGLCEDRTTALIMFGGNGSMVAAGIHEALLDTGLPVQSIVLCGQNKALLEEMAARPYCHAQGFTDRVADYMRLADVFVGKPGPGCLSEALHMGLPAIVECNARTLVQERYNATWIEERGLGIALSSFADIGKAVTHLLNGTTLDEYRRRARSMENRAVFEIQVILEAILNEAKAVRRTGSALEASDAAA